MGGLCMSVIDSDGMPPAGLGTQSLEESNETFEY